MSAIYISSYQQHSTSFCGHKLRPCRLLCFFTSTGYVKELRDWLRSTGLLTVPVCFRKGLLCINARGTCNKSFPRTSGRQLSLGTQSPQPVFLTGKQWLIWHTDGTTDRSNFHRSSAPFLLSAGGSVDRKEHSSTCDGSALLFSHFGCSAFNSWVQWNRYVSDQIQSWPYLTWTWLIARNNAGPLRHTYSLQQGDWLLQNGKKQRHPPSSRSWGY